MKLRIKNRNFWIYVSSVFALLIVLFGIYVAVLFGDITDLMVQTPAATPSILYSDIYVVKKGDLAANSFLKERLQDLKIEFTEKEGTFSWKERHWEVPETLLPAASPLHAPRDAKIRISVGENRINNIEVDEESRDAIALEPTQIARLSSSTKTIQEYVSIEDIPTRLLQAIIAIEDQRFLEHHGFDPRSLFRALWINFRSQSLAQGGSTLTQQLIKNLLGTRQKTITRKVRELILAILIEFRYSKEEILQKYLNEIYFGQIGAMEVHGVSEAARYFFNKSLDKLTLGEMAMMAGVIRGPALYSPYKNKERTIERRNTVLKKMGELKIVSDREMKNALAEKLNLTPPLAGINKAPYFVDFVKAQILDELRERISVEDLSSQGLKIFTTVDLPIQRRADEAVEKNVVNLETRYKIQRPMRLEGLLIAAQPSTGFVRALVGGRSYAETTYNRVLNMKRQVGSSFKPIAYLSAFLKGTDEAGVNYSPAYMVDDEPWSYKYDKQEWTPKNYEKSYRGHITLREAFINSINIPMAKIAVDVGIGNIIDVAEKLGINTRLPKVPSIALGSVDLAPMELLQVYSVFANRGERVDLTTVRMITDISGNVVANYNAQSTQVIEAKYIDLLNSLLRDVILSGTGRPLSQMGYVKTAYGKTGTTNFSRDAWFTGFSQDLSAVTWVGFEELKVPDEEDEKAKRKYKSPAALTGAGSAMPMWASFMRATFPSGEELPVKGMDDSLIKVKVDRATGCQVNIEPTSIVEDDETTFEAYFISGTQPACP